MRYAFVMWLAMTVIQTPSFFFATRILEINAGWLQAASVAGIVALVGVLVALLTAKIFERSL